MKASLAFALLPTIAVWADYPAELVWTNNEGHLEFCKDGSNYGLRALGDTTACGSRPGPLIRMQKGTKYKLTLHNTAASGTITNIHTHGLHIPGDGNADDVTRHVDGGDCLDYEWDIASDHPPGTYWYHPHYHGATKNQVAGGAMGMIIIDDDANQVNAWAAPQNEKLLQIVDFGGGGGVKANGVSNGDEEILLEADSWYRLRVSTVNLDAAHEDLRFVTSNGSGCTVYKVASDGIWHNAALTTYSGSSFSMTGASRADFAVKCSSGETQIRYGSTGNGSLAAKINAGSHSTGTGDSSPGTDADVLGSAPTRPVSLNFDKDDSYFSSTAVQLTGGGININGTNYQSGSTLVDAGDIVYEKIHELTLSSTGIHPFHLHLYHMLVITPGGCGEHEFGEFYDTISHSSDCTVRFKAIDIGQKMVFHCHFLQHEDNGAIAYMDVINTPISAQNMNDGSPVSCPIPPPTPSPTTPVLTLSPTPNPTPSPVVQASCGAEGASCNNNNQCCGTCEGSGSNKKCGPDPNGPPAPTPHPTPSPSASPTSSPSHSPSRSPSVSPSSSPSASPSVPPSFSPTSSPTVPCSKSQLGDSCNNDADCCNNSCRPGSGGLKCREPVRYLRAGH